MCNIFGGMHDGVVRRKVWHREFRWKEGDGVAYAFGVGADNVYFPASVVEHGRSEIPAVDTMGIPGIALAGFFMSDDACVWRS